ncbi:MAG TPA: hypothetical protein VFZ02_03345 [Ktedonobacteraceae bacterium]
MRSSKSTRQQNLHPDALIQSRKDAAERNKEAVRIAVQAMQKRKVDPQKITVPAVAEESGVSQATIYRREALFALVRKANPRLQRRLKEQVHQDDLARLQNKLADAGRDVEYYKSEAELAKLAIRQWQSKNGLLRKQLVERDREIDRLQRQLAACTCQVKEHLSPLQ